MSSPTGLVYVTRKLHFNAAHKLYNLNWSEETNFEVFGKCANHNWHGHNFELFVTVKGIPNPETGFVIDLNILKELVEEKVINKLDHRNLNLDVDFMAGQMTTIENLAVAIWNELQPFISPCQLHSIKLYETHQQFTEYYG